MGADIKRLLRALIGLAAAGFAVLAYVYLTLPDVRVLAATNPTTTAFMELREAQAASDGKTLRHVHRWVPYSRISQNLKRAVLVAEDDAFWDHEGVDMEQIRKSIEINLERGTAVRGASRNHLRGHAQKQTMLHDAGPRLQLQRQCPGIANAISKPALGQLIAVVSNQRRPIRRQP